MAAFQRNTRSKPATRRATPALLSVLVASALLGACTTTPPANTSNACAIFAEKRGWWDATRDAERRWGVPPHIQLAIIYQESGFDADARPDREKLLFIIPWNRPSSAYGYSQALDGTWAEYRDSARRRGADRDNFRAATDFVAWYGRQSQRRSGISLTDAYSQYLAYHEGHGGYNRGSYRGNSTLKRSARRVAAQAARYERQIAGCRKDLQRFWFAFY